MSAIEKYDGGLANQIETFGSLAGQIAQTDFVPDAFKRNPAAVLACMLFGQECGLGPMASLNLTQSIKGKVGLKPEGMRAVVQSHGHRIWPEEYTDTAVTLCGWRKGDPEDVVVRVRWTMEDAKRANLTGGESWKKYPRAMLLARATSELCRLHFSDCTGGLAYGGDELEEIAGNAPSSPRSTRPHIEPVSRETVADTKPAARRGPRKPPNVNGEGEVIEAEVVDDKPNAANGFRVARDEPRPATDAQVADITDVISGLKDAGDEWAQRGRDAWKKAGVPPVPAARLSEDQAALAYEALAEVYREAVAAQAPFDGPDAA